MLIRVGNKTYNLVNCNLAASPPNPLPDRGGGIRYLYLLRF